MKLTIKADWDDHSATVVTDLYTIVAWERKFKRKVGDGNDMGLEDLAFLFHEQAKRTDGVVVPVVFDDFIKKLQDITCPSGDNARPT